MKSKHKRFIDFYLICLVIFFVLSVSPLFHTFFKVILYILVFAPLAVLIFKNKVLFHVLILGISFATVYTVLSAVRLDPNPPEIQKNGIVAYAHFFGYPLTFDNISFIIYLSIFIFPLAITFISSLYEKRK